MARDRINGNARRHLSGGARSADGQPSVIAVFIAVAEVFIPMSSPQKWHSPIWVLLGVSMALLFAKDGLALRAGAEPAWPFLLSLFTGLALASSCIAQGRGLRSLALSRLVAVGCLPYALGNLVIVLRFASIWSLVALALAAAGLVLSLSSFRSFSTPQPP
jgi:hypothetical protein